METIAVLALLAVLVVAVLVVLWKQQKLPANVAAVVGKGAGSAQSLVSDIEKAIAKHKASNAAPPVAPVPTPIPIATTSGPGDPPKSFPNIAAFDAWLPTFAWSVMLDARMVQTGFGPPVQYATQADGTILRSY